MSWRVEIRGADQVERRLIAMANVLDGPQRLVMLRSGAMIVSNDAKRRAPYKTGTLRRSIAILKETTDKVWVGSDVPYARIQEMGGTIQLPTIYPRNAKALRFEVGGQVVFAKRARAHPVHIPARPYLRPALYENRGRIIREMGDAAFAMLKAAA